MMQQALQLAKDKLSMVTDHAALDADILLAHTLNKPRSFLYTATTQNLTCDQLTQFKQFIDRRAKGEPVAYITGKKEFWSLTLSVTPITLIPRPETELIVEQALALFGHSAAKVADLGTGSGAIALALASERNEWQLFATDRHEKILQVASKNAHDLGINNISFYEGSWCTALPCKDFDMVISNPPYIALTEWEDYAAGLAYEPSTALVSGQDGLDAIREISREARLYIKLGGYLLIEHGFSQGTAAREIFEQDGYENVRTIRDLAGNERVTIGKFGLQLISG